MPQILYQKEGNHPDATMVFADGSTVKFPQGSRHFFGTVIGKLDDSHPPKERSGEVSTAKDNQGAEAAAMREALLQSRGDIILVTDNSKVARFAARVIRGVYETSYPQTPTYSQEAFRELRKTLQGQKGRIMAIYFAPHEEYREQRRAHDLCRKAGSHMRTHAQWIAAQKQGDDKSKSR